MAVTIYDIARELSLSHTTVSRVLNQRDDRFISDRTRQRVLQAARQLGYRPRRAARALATGRTHQVGLVLRHLDVSYYAEVLRTVSHQIGRTEYQMLIATMEATDAEDASGHWHWEVDGCLAFETMPQALAAARNGWPLAPCIVGLGGCDFSAEGVDFVGVDLRTGAREATEHLLEIGCRRIAFVTPGAHPLSGETRQNAYRAAVLAAGLSPEFIAVPKLTRASARQAVREYIETQGCPDGLFCFNDDTALGAYRALRDLQKRIPDEVALVGCDGIQDTEYLDCPITTIRQPIDDVCIRGWELLQRRMDAPESPLEQILLKPELVLRESTRRQRRRIDNKKTKR